MGPPLTLGALGKTTQAEAVIQQYEAEIAATRDQLTDKVATQPKLLLLGASRLDEGVIVIDPDSYLGELLSGIGFELIPPPAAALDAANPLMSIEILPTLNEADTIIVLGWNFEASADDQNSESPVDASVTHQI